MSKTKRFRKGEAHRHECMDCGKPWICRLPCKMAGIENEQARCSTCSRQWFMKGDISRQISENLLAFGAGKIGKDEFLRNECELWDRADELALRYRIDA